MQVRLAPGTSVFEPGHDSGDNPANGSVTVTPVSVTLPLFVATIVNVTTSPAIAATVGDAVFEIVSAGACAAGTVTPLESVTAAPTGGVPEATALLTIDPVSRSAWVDTYVAVQVVVAPGASVVTGQVTADRPGNGSATPTPDSVTLPVLVTANEYVTTCAGAVHARRAGRLHEVDRRRGGGGDQRRRDVGDGTGRRPAAVAVAVAEFAIEPASMSACVAPYVAVHTVDAAGARVVTGQVTAPKPASGSVMTEPGERDVARVRHGERVGDGLAGGGDRRGRCRLHEVDRRGGRREHRLGVGRGDVRAGSCGVTPR